MKVEKFKELDQQMNNYSFNTSYSNINKIMKGLSYFGNMTSIFLAYFFMSDILSGPIGDNQALVVAASLIILIGVELLKRDIFDKFSIQSLKDNTIKKTALPLAILSVLLIFLSFYSSLSGAKKFSSKSDEIEVKTVNKLDDYRDSLTTIYDTKIGVIENRNKILFNQNIKFDEEAAELPGNYISAKENIRSNKKVNLEQISINKEEIDELKEEFKTRVDTKSNSLTNKSSKEKEKNSDNSFLFIILSTFIELIILGGVYFNQYYRFRSYKEFRKKIEKDPKYQKWLLYDEILSNIVSSETKMNEKLPSNKSIIDTCKVNDIIILPKDIKDFMKVLLGLGIIKSSGSARYIIKEREMAKETLRNHFNIK